MLEHNEPEDWDYADDVSDIDDADRAPNHLDADDELNQAVPGIAANDALRTQLRHYLNEAAPVDLDE